MTEKFTLSEEKIKGNSKELEKNNNQLLMMLTIEDRKVLNDFK